MRTPDQAESVSEEHTNGGNPIDMKRRAESPIAEVLGNTRKGSPRCALPIQMASLETENTFLLSRCL